MGRKRIKQYLMLLLVIGVIAVAASGSGTFASFSAEVTNANNVFATGSLILNNTHGTTTCTSAINSGASSSNNNVNSTGHDCSTLFNVAPFSYVHGTMAAGANGDTSITFATLTGGTIYRGDVLTITPNTGSSFTVTTTNTTPVSAPGSVSISGTLGHTFTTGTILDGSPTALADVTLQNAGTLAANDVVITPSGCTNSYREGSATLGSAQTLGGAVGNAIPVTAVSGSWQLNDPIIVTEGSHSQTFIATGNVTGGTIPIQSGQNWNFAYSTAAKVSGPQFNGNTANSICGQLLLSITENSSASFPAAFTNASGCVYGGNANPVNTSACDLTQGIALSTASTASTLGTDTLAPGASRYYQLAVHLNSSGFDNTYQNTAGTGFSLTWHVDQ